MANPTKTDFNKALAAFLAFGDNAAIFEIKKVDPSGGEVDASGIRSNAGVLWPDGMDDLLQYILQRVPRRRYDNRQVVASADRLPAAAPVILTGTVAPAGTADFSIADVCTDGKLLFLRVVATGALSDNVKVQLFRDAARTVEIYAVVGVDPSTQFTDRNPATLMGDDGATLENRTIYGRLTNNAASGDDFEIEAVVEGVN